MASRSLGTLTLDVIAQVGGFVAGMDKAERSSTKWRKQVAKDMKAAGTAIAAGVTAAAGALAALTTSTIENANEISRFAAVSNTSTTEFQKLAAGAKMVGVENDKLSDILKDVNDKVGDFLLNGGGELQDFFKTIAPKVGVTAEQFRDLSGPDALQLFASSLEKAGLSQAEMTQQMESLANDATLLLPLLKNNSAGFKAFGDAAQSAGAIMDDKTIKAARELSAATWLVEEATTGVKNQLMTALLPALSNFATTLNDTAGNGLLATTITNDLADGFKGLAKYAVGAVAGIHLLAVGLKTLSDLDSASMKGASWWEKWVPPARIYETFKNFGNVKQTLSDAGVKMDGLAQSYTALIQSFDKPPDKNSNAQIKQLADLLDQLKKGGKGTFVSDSAGQAAAKAAAKAFETTEQGYQRQIKLINTTGDKSKEATETQKLEFETVSGKLKDLSSQQKERLMQLAEELDLLKKKKKANEEDLEAAKFAAQLTRENNTTKAGLDDQLAGSGQGDKARQRLQELSQIQQEFDQKQADLLQQHTAGDISDELYDKEKKSLESSLNERKKIQQDYYDAQDEAQSNWLDGVSDAWQNYVDISSDYQQQAADAVAGILNDTTSSISDQLKGLEDGTLTLGDAFKNLGLTMADSVLGALNDIAAKWIVTHALKLAGIGEETAATVAGEATKSAAKVAADGVGTASTLAAIATTTAANVTAAATTLASWLPAALVASVGTFGAAAIVGGAGLLAAFALIHGFSDGGYTGAGGVNDPAGIVHKGEVVWSQADIARAGGVATVEAMRKGNLDRSGAASGGKLDRTLDQVQSSSSGAGGRNVTFNAPVTVQAQPGMSGEDARAQGKTISDAIKQQMGQFLDREMAQGGRLWRR